MCTRLDSDSALERTALETLQGLEGVWRGSRGGLHVHAAGQRLSTVYLLTNYNWGCNRHTDTDEGDGSGPPRDLPLAVLVGRARVGPAGIFLTSPRAIGY
eukprot:1180404-Prorocentrum_minimum.AAC.3